MESNFIHIAFDSIFVDSVISQFENINPKKNEYYIDIDEQKDTIKRIKNKDLIKKTNLSNQEQKLSLISTINSTKLVFFHCLSDNMVEVINNLDQKVKIVWMIWGDEMNLKPILLQKSLKPLTYNFIKKENSSTLKYIYSHFLFLHKIMFFLQTKQIHPIIRRKKAFSRINYGAFFIQEDLDFFNKRNNFEIMPFWFSYYNIEDTCGEIVFENQIKKKNILIGNSGDPRNNHLDIFHNLSAFNLENRLIICPLNYGASEKYFSKIISEGEYLFKDKIEFIKEFIPLNEYNKYIQNCSVVIMNHIVQQAVGNIVTALWAGAKVYLNEENPVFQYFKKVGVLIFSISNDLKISNKNALTPLNEVDSVKNREILYTLLSKKNVLSELKKSLNLIK